MSLGRPGIRMSPSESRTMLVGYSAGALGALGALGAAGALGAEGALGAFGAGAPDAGAASSMPSVDSLQNGHLDGSAPPMRLIFFPQLGQITGGSSASAGLKHMLSLPFDRVNEYLPNGIKVLQRYSA